MPAAMTIGELAVLYGVSLRTLRFYESRGMLQPIRKGTARFYTPKDRLRLELIIKGKKFGFSLSDIEKMIGIETKAEDSDEASVHADFVNRLGKEEIVIHQRRLEQRRMELDFAIGELREALSKDTG